MYSRIKNLLSLFNKDTFHDFLEIIRLKFHLNFAFVILGATSFSERIDTGLIFSLLLMYLSFNVFVYGGIYTMNAITDLDKDSQHPLKCNRPLPSGRISKQSAIKLALSLMSIGTFLGFLLFGINVGFIYVVFITINLFYSLVARNIPYLELFVNASTMPLRLLMGTCLVIDSLVPTSLMFGAFCVGIGFLSVRRIVEKDIQNSIEARPALKAYQGNTMLWIQLVSFIGLILAFSSDIFIQQTFTAYLLMVIYFIIFCLGVHFSKYLRSYWRNFYGY